MAEVSSYHVGNLREQLLTAAFELLDEGGVDAVGIRQIARAVGVAHSAPANHFKNKRALYTAMAAEIFAHLAELTQVKSASESRGLRGAIHDFSDVILAFGLKYPNRYLLMWRKDCFDCGDPTLNEAQENVYQQLTSLLLQHGRNTQVDVESQAIALWSLIHGYVSLRLDSVLQSGQDSISGLERQKVIIDVIIDGIAE